MKLFDEMLIQDSDLDARPAAEGNSDAEVESTLAHAEQEDGSGDEKPKKKRKKDKKKRSSPVAAEETTLQAGRTGNRVG